MDNNTEPMMIVNMELVDKVFKHLHKRNNWNQRGWIRKISWSKLSVFDFLADETAENSACGSTMCFGGWACVISGNVVKSDTTSDGMFPVWNGKTVDWLVGAARALGFNPYLAELVFFNFNTDLDDFEREVREAITKYGNLTRTQAMQAYYNKSMHRSEYSPEYLFNVLFPADESKGEESFDYDNEHQTSPLVLA